jgi:hypothetical protein
MQMHARRDDRRSNVMPVILTVIIAVVSTAGVVLGIFVPRNDAQGGRSAAMITAATLSKAGAIQTPSEPLTGRGV